MLKYFRSESRFVRTMTRAFERRFGQSVEFEEEEFRLRTSSGMVINLGNIFRTWQNTSGKKWRAELEMFLNAMDSAQRPDTEDWETVRPLLKTRVYDASYIMEASIAAEEQPSENALVWRACETLPDFLVEALVIDLPEAVMSVNTDNVATWGVDVDQAYSIARGNLRAENTNRSSLEELAPGFMASAWNDCFDTSRLVFTDLFGQLPFGGPAMAILLSRDVLLLADSCNAEAVAAMVTTVHNSMNDMRVECVEPLILDNGRWHPVERGIHPEIDRLIMLHRRDVWDSQKRLLENQLERAEQDIFVANFLLAESDNGDIHSIASWGHNVDTLLPETDFIVFGFERQKPQYVQLPWAVVEDNLADLMERHTCSVGPDRIRVRRSPDPEAVHSLHAALKG